MNVKKLALAVSGHPQTSHRDVVVGLHDAAFMEDFFTGMTGS